MKKSIVAAVMLACAGAAFGQVRINEILINVPSPEPDNTREFVEFLSEQPSASLAGYWFIVIDGDNNAAGDSIATGVVDLAINLSSYTTGANGLLLLRDAASPVLQPAPSPSTSVVILNDWFGCGANNVPGNIDIENGSSTYLIVRNFTGTVCQDLDTNNDGILDSTPWTEVIDAVGFINGDDFDNGIAAREYASQLGGVDVTDRSPGAPGFTADSFFRLCDFTAGIDAFGISSAPYVADPGELVTVPAGNTLPGTFTLTPGNPNVEECGPVCIADVDDGSGTGTLDGGVGIEDLLYYLGLYDSGVSGADVDDGSGSGTPDGGVGIEDLLYYLSRYDAGC